MKPFRNIGHLSLFATSLLLLLTPANTRISTLPLGYLSVFPMVFLPFLCLYRLLVLCIIYPADVHFFLITVITYWLRRLVRSFSPFYPIHFFLMISLCRLLFCYVLENSPNCPLKCGRLGYLLLLRRKPHPYYSWPLHLHLLEQTDNLSSSCCCRLSQLPQSFSCWIYKYS